MTMDVMEIQEILPHRYPFLLIDKVTNIKMNKIWLEVPHVFLKKRFGTSEY
jgi:3-hydroxymyristoyl/3-hydroxydecanoyl-(acyl carrier protein) dehydratase